MSRRDGNSVFDLSKAIDEYKESKDKENALKKANDRMGKDIKQYMIDNDMTKANGDKYTVTMSKTVKQKLNEDLAIEIIKENLDGALLASVIKKKEYIDDDALEKLVYNGQFDIQLLQKAKIIKPPTITLRISKKKGD